MIFETLAVFEKEAFEKELDDQKWFKGKQRGYLEQVKNKKHKKLGNY